MTVYSQEFGGSAKVASELFNMLHPNNPELVTEDELKEQLDNVLKLYLKKKDDDKSGQWTTLFLWISARAFFIFRLKTEVLIENTGWFYTQMYRYGMFIKYGVSHRPRDHSRQWYTDRRISGGSCISII